MNTDRKQRCAEFNRRNFLTVTASSAAVPLVTSFATGSSAKAQMSVADPRDPVNVRLRINGREQRIALDVRTTLLDALRDHVGLTGTKKGLRPWAMRRMHGAH